MKPLTPELLLAAMDAGQTVQRDQTLPITDWADGDRLEGGPHQSLGLAAARYRPADLGPDL